MQKAMEHDVSHLLSDGLRDRKILNPMDKR